jgi:putative addiction module component (TIGR02574 family)
MTDAECNGRWLELEWTTRASLVKFLCAAYNSGMTDQALELLQKALALSQEERTAMARSLIESLEGAPQEGAERAWDEEIARRTAELDSGKAKTVSWEEVRQRISTRLARNDGTRYFFRKL